MNIAPLGLIETSQMPICPIRNSSMGDDIKNNTCGDQENKGKGCGQRSDFSHTRNLEPQIRK
jgi:hypothetical protein